MPSGVNSRSRNRPDHAQRSQEPSHTEMSPSDRVGKSCPQLFCMVCQKSRMHHVSEGAHDWAEAWLSHGLPPHCHTLITQEAHGFGSKVQDRNGSDKGLKNYCIRTFLKLEGLPAMLHHFHACAGVHHPQTNGTKQLKCGQFLNMISFFQSNSCSSTGQASYPLSKSPA